MDRSPTLSRFTAAYLPIFLPALLVFTSSCDRSSPPADGTTADISHEQAAPSSADLGQLQSIHLNAGGGDIQVESGIRWQTGSAYALGGKPFINEATCDTLNLPAAAPTEIYATARHDDHAYSFPNLPDGRYRIRLHFVDPDPHGSRQVDIDVNDRRVLAAYEQRATAGDINTLIIEDIVAEVSAGEGLVIACGKGGGDDVYVAAVEIFPTPEDSPLTPAATAPLLGKAPPLPKDLVWLRELSDDGCLAYSDGTSIYLCELSNPAAQKIGQGIAPEWSPNGQFLAWIDGSDVRGRCRSGDVETHLLANGISPEAGVHWVDDSTILVRFEHERSSQWAHVQLGGETWPNESLNPLQPGENRTDLRSNGEAWSYVADRQWQTHKGNSGHIGGVSAASLSPDGKSVTAVQDNGLICKLNAIHPDGHQGSLRWPYAGTFSQHRWSSNHSRFVVCTETGTSSLAVIDILSSRATGVVNLPSASAASSGDFTTGAAENTTWPISAGGPPVASQIITASIATQTSPNAEPVPASTGVSWPQDRSSLVFLWEDHNKENAVTDPLTGRTRHAEGILRGSARFNAHHGISLHGGSYIPADLRDDIKAACMNENAFSLEMTLRVDSPSSANKGRIVSFGGGGDIPSHFLLEDVGGELWFTLRTDNFTSDEEAPAWRLGRLLAEQYHHLLISYKAGLLVGYLDGEEAFSSEDLTGGLQCWGSGDGPLIFGLPTWLEEPAWDGQIEAIAIRTAPIQGKEALELYALALKRLEGRQAIPRPLIKATLNSIAKVPTAESITPFRRCLVEAHYTVEEVISGELAEKEIRVLHWVIEDAQDLGFRWQGGESYFLKCEALGAHPEISDEHRVSLNPARLDLPAFLEMGRAPVNGEERL